MAEGDHKNDVPYEPRPLIKHNDKDGIMRDGSNFIVIVGKSGTGKTLLLNHLIPKQKLKNIIITSVIRDNDCHKAIFDWADKKGIDACVVNTLADAQSAVNIAARKHDLLKYEPQKQVQQHSALVFDDFSTYRSGRDNSFNNFAIICFSTLRNKGFSMYFVTQDYSNVPTLVCSNETHVFIFPFTNFYGLVRLMNDLRNNMEPETLKRAACVLIRTRPTWIKLRDQKDTDDDDDETQKKMSDPTPHPTDKKKRKRVRAVMPGDYTADEEPTTPTTKEPKRRRGLIQTPDFERFWKVMTERINSEPYTYCLCKIPNEIFINKTKIS